MAASFSSSHGVQGAIVNYHTPLAREPALVAALALAVTFALFSCCCRGRSQSPKLAAQSHPPPTWVTGFPVPLAG